MLGKKRAAGVEVRRPSKYEARDGGKAARTATAQQVYRARHTHRAAGVDRPRGAGVVRQLAYRGLSIQRAARPALVRRPAAVENPTSDKRRAQLLLLGLRRGRIVASLLNFLGLCFGGRPTWGFRGRLFFSLFSIRAAYQEGHRQA